MSPQRNTLYPLLYGTKNFDKRTKSPGSAPSTIIRKSNLNEKIGITGRLQHVE